MKTSRYATLTARTPSDIKRQLAYYQNMFRKLEKAGADFDVLHDIHDTIEDLREALRFAYADEENDQD